MTMAALTNLPLEGDGVIENLFYYLWNKDEFDRSPAFNIPDTILFHYAQPSQWYFTSTSGKLKRKNKSNTTNVKIEHEFTKASIGNNIIAYYMSKNSKGRFWKQEQRKVILTSAGVFTIEYLDEEALRK